MVVALNKGRWDRGAEQGWRSQAMGLHPGGRQTERFSFK